MCSKSKNIETYIRKSESSFQENEGKKSFAFYGATHENNINSMQSVLMIQFNTDLSE